MIGSHEMKYNYTNKETGMESIITNHEKGFSVSFRDTDSGEYLPYNKIFPVSMKKEAFTFARKITKQ